MAGNSIRINTDQVAETAANMENLNLQLDDILQKSRQAVDSLRNIWQGEAAEETIASYDAFSARYFENYKEIINNYVAFLRGNVQEDYIRTENANVSLAEAFK